MTHKPAPVSWDFRNDWEATNLGIPLRHVVRFLVDQTSSFCLGSEWFWANFKPCKTIVSMGYAMYILASDLLIHGCTRPQKYQRYWLALVTETIRNTYSNHHETRYDATHGSIPQRMTLLTLFGIAQLWAPSIPLHSLNSPSWRVANYSLTSQFISIQSELAWDEALREQKWYLAVRFNGHTSLIPGLPAITKLWAKHWFDSKECTQDLMFADLMCSISGQCDDIPHLQTTTQTSPRPTLYVKPKHAMHPSPLPSPVVWSFQPRRSVVHPITEYILSRQFGGKKKTKNLHDGMTVKVR